MLRGALSEWPPVLRWSDDAYLLASSAGCRVPVRRAEERARRAEASSKRDVEKAVMTTMSEFAAWRDGTSILDRAEERLTIRLLQDRRCLVDSRAIELLDLISRVSVKSDLSFFS